MLKFSTCIGAWIFTILLLVAPITKTKRNNVINTTDSPMYNLYQNYCYHQYCERLKSSDCFSLNFSHTIRDVISVFLNRLCVYDTSVNKQVKTSKSEYIKDLKRLQRLSKTKLKIIPIYSEAILFPDTWVSVFTYYINDTLVFNNTLTRSIKERKNKNNHVNYKWKRRTLCGIVEKEKYSATDLSDENIFENVDNPELMRKKTLLYYDAPDLINDIEDQGALKAHVRVKRNRLEPDYLKDLANSFPKNNYDSMDENFYDDYGSTDTKREIGSEDFFLNNQQFSGSPDENEQPKILSAPPITISANVNNQKSPVNDVKEVASGTIQGNTFINDNCKSEDQSKNENSKTSEEPKNNIAIGQPYESLENENIPEDPMLAEESVREKRDDDAKVNKKASLENKASPEFQDSVDQSEKFSEGEKRSVIEPEKYEHSTPSSLVAANLEAKLLRIRRKTKENRREKNSKSKKKKKHTGKKHNVARSSQRSKHVERSTVDRTRKKNEARKDGKSKIGIASVVSRKNNGNNFHRRSENAKKSVVDKVETDSERFSRNVAKAEHEKVKRGTKSNSNVNNGELSLYTEEQLSVANDEPNIGSKDDTNALLHKGEKQEPSVEHVESIEPPHDESVVKKASEDLNHGFLNKEEELRYYENIREPGSDRDNCNEDRVSMNNEPNRNRAVRSIEEVKELAKKLVTKVNELQNYLNVEDASKADKREKIIQTRAIDDLCSNVSSACDAYKESPETIKKCVPSPNHADSTAKIVGRKVDPVKIVKNQRFVKNINKKSVEKKRSIGRRTDRMPINNSKRSRQDGEANSDNKWGKWTDWSSCSVTCGKGRQIRWRYCLQDCSTAETEMEEKACQLPACPPGKFLGIF